MIEPEEHLWAAGNTEVPAYWFLPRKAIPSASPILLAVRRAGPLKIRQDLSSGQFAGTARTGIHAWGSWRQLEGVRSWSWCFHPAFPSRWRRKM